MWVRLEYLYFFIGDYLKKNVEFIEIIYFYSNILVYFRGKLISVYRVLLLLDIYYFGV